MKLLATYICVLLCLSLGVRSDWPPAVKKVLDKSPITPEDLEKMLEEEKYSKVANCGNKFGVNISDVFSPSEECDQAGVNYLKVGVEDYTAFNVEAYMNGFWNSTVGEKFLDYFKGRSVSDIDLREAMDEFWFTEDNGTTAFQKIFFDSEGTEYRDRYDNWYTYSIAKQLKELNCTAKKSAYPESAAVTVFCPEVNLDTDTTEGKQQAGFSTFAYPSHPYDDMISYTLCAWKTVTEPLTTYVEACKRATGGGKIVDIRAFKIECSYGEDYCLNSVHIY